ncbi:MAG: hypothetical protein COA62_12350 [Rhodobiaceae bacterium]|nr:MAG: hypothetical protein COA62_12350 [Rhodobiaceae bacterium]
MAFACANTTDPSSLEIRYWDGFFFGEEKAKRVNSFEEIVDIGKRYLTGTFFCGDEAVQFELGVHTESSDLNTEIDAKQSYWNVADFAVVKIDDVFAHITTSHGTPWRSRTSLCLEADLQNGTEQLVVFQDVLWNGADVQIAPTSVVFNCPNAGFEIEIAFLFLRSGSFPCYISARDGATKLVLFPKNFCDPSSPQATVNMAVSLFSLLEMI